MNLASLFELLKAARAECAHAEYVVIGSLSILGMSEVSELPQDMTLSIDADCYTPADPGRIFDLAESLGEHSRFRREHGYYLDPVSPKLATLPEGWELRMIPLERDGIRGFFLEPNDAAISKLARGEPRDVRWVRAGVRAGLVSVPVLRLRLRHTDFFDAAERDTAQRHVDAISKAAKR
ncbi:MAG TPA: DUF6036 family nucleotidyltransferase [Ramlibacter sp.]|uniref:DUF6036 family nucleotidyltransferase n=1 Tax=Ramlibacter sp. TaxID=1917967 RepID=UPI002C653CF3|nr:DUF6036 family nucleotidyltransferase [Ramlibacter sp.]HVZ46722.1 DUF6036 family nucleotidyltransferase [Ramlibacter sp.]